MNHSSTILPADEFNAQLVAEVHPPDWINPTPSGRYNLVVIGGGTAGLVTASGAAGLGAKVALVESHWLGGDCLNFGCVPSKGVISAARMAAAARRAHEFGLQADVSVNFPQVMQRMRGLRSSIAKHDGAARFRSLGVDVFLGRGAFIDGQTLQVNDARISFSKAVIATGARAAVPKIPGLEQIKYLTNETVFSLTELPARLGVIGAGPIGCELAQAFAQLGSRVVLIHDDRVMPREERDAAEIVRRALEQDGVAILGGGRSLQVSPSTNGGASLMGGAGEEAWKEDVDQLLIATGRAPNVETLNLEKANVEFDTRLGVKVNDFLQTTNPNIYAAGDVCSRFKFTHAADFMARIVIQNALFRGRVKASSLIIPWCTYTSPEIAHVGLSEHELREQGIPFDTYMQPMSGVDRAILEGETEGFVKVHVKHGIDRILGGTIVAKNAGDMISQLTMAMKYKLGLKKLGSVIYPYPTQAEAIRKLGDQYNRTRLTPFVKSMFARWLAWMR